MRENSSTRSLLFSWCRTAQQQTHCNTRRIPKRERRRRNSRHVSKITEAGSSLRQTTLPWRTGGSGSRSVIGPVIVAVRFRPRARRHAFACCPALTLCHPPTHLPGVLFPLQPSSLPFHSRHLRPTPTRMHADAVWEAELRRSPGYGRFCVAGPPGASRLRHCAFYSLRQCPEAFEQAAGRQGGRGRCGRRPACIAQEA